MEKLLPIKIKGRLLIPYNGGYIDTETAAKMVFLDRNTISKYFSRDGRYKLNTMEELLEYREKHGIGCPKKKVHDDCDRYYFRGEDMTLLEIAELTGMSYNGVRYRVKVWEKKGCIGDPDFEPHGNHSKKYGEKDGRIKSYDTFAAKWERENTSKKLPNEADMLEDWRRCRNILGGEAMMKELHPQYEETISFLIERLEKRLHIIQGESYEYYKEMPRKQGYTSVKLA